MLASDKLIDALNGQVGNELAASNQYVSIGSYFAGENLDQLAQFFYRQADEERAHAMKFVRFIVDVGGTVRIPEVPAARAGFESALEAVEISLGWENEVTRQVYDLVETAQADKNFIALRFLDWFVAEQLEEVSTMGALLAVVKRAGEDGLLHVEEYLARGGLTTGGSEEGGGE